MERRERLFIFMFVLAALASGGDLAFDLSHGVSDIHVFQELVVFIVALAMLAYLSLEVRRSAMEMKALRQAIDDIQSNPPEKSPLVDHARQQLREAIAVQFEDWGLTQSEREVGMMLLKGFSLKEISVLRGTAEKTTRQQASSIYQKSGVSGRHAFSAWFVEDLI